MQKNFRKKKVYASAGLSTSAPADETVKWKMKYFAKQKKRYHATCSGAWSFIIKKRIAK